jgi:hypothetical protein
MVGRGPGGFAAIQIALRLGASTVVAFSPEISVKASNGPHTAKFLEAAFGRLTLDSGVAARLDVVQALDLFGQGEARIVLAYNVDDQRYVRRQLPQAERLVKKMREGTAVIVPYATENRAANAVPHGRELEMRLKAELNSMGVSWDLELAR